MASAGGAAQEPDIFEIGNVIDDQYVISARLGKGGYGEIYRATSIKDGSVVAVKVERATKSGNLFEELSILNTLASTSCLLPHLQ
jgi:serine/threonine protein kinase